MDLLKISNYIDDFFEKRNGELKFSRKLVNKEYAKKIGLILFFIVTMMVNSFGELLENLGFGKRPNFIIGLFKPRPSLFLVYIFMYILVGFIYIKLLFSIRASFKEIDEGQKGTSRFATRKEVDKQYRSVPIANELYKGKGGVPIARGYKNYITIDGKKVRKEVMYIDDSPVNNLIIGTTRSGKGETFVVPMIDIYSRASQKASLVINDPKGELMAMCKEMLEYRGYDVYMLNLLQPINSMSYNPLELIKQAYERKDYSEAQLLCKTLTHSLYYKPNVKDPFWQNSAMSLVNALILAVCDECIARNEKEKITMYTVANMLSELGGDNYTNENEEEKNKLDEYFKSLPNGSVAKSQYATSSFAGGSARGNIFSVAMSELQTYTLEETGKLTSKNSLDFEDIGFYTTFKCKVLVSDTISKTSEEDSNNEDTENTSDEKYIKSDENKEITNNPKNKVFGIQDIVVQKDYMKKEIEDEEKSQIKNNIKNDYENYGQYTTLSKQKEELSKIENESEELTLEEQLYYKRIEEKQKSRIILEKQRTKLINQLLKNVKAFNVDGKDVTSEITIDISEVNFNQVGEYEVEYKIPLNRPKAVFMVTPDYDKSNHVLASIFVRQIYYVLAKKASLNDTSKCDREVIFLLDEFGNMPSIEGFANIITVCLGRGIRFNMIIQAYSQLKNLYGEDAPTIEGNCGNQIYIMTNENDTAEKFSKLLGEKTIITNSRSGEVFSLNKSQTESLDARRLLKADELTKLKEGETVVVRVIKRTDNNKEKIVSYPIFNEGENRMKYRYEYLNKTFNNNENVFKNVKVESLHKDVELKDLIIDFSKSADEVKKENEEKVKRLDSKIENLLNLKNNRNQYEDEKTNGELIKENNNEDTINSQNQENYNDDKKENSTNTHKIEDSNGLNLKFERNREQLLKNIENKLLDKDKIEIRNLSSKEEIKKYLSNKNNSLVNYVDLFFKD